MTDRMTPDVREAHDAANHAPLRADPAHQDAKLDIALDESFPTSDAPSQTRPGSNEPAASSGYDEDSERRILEARENGSSGGVTVTARFATRREADLAVEQIVQDKGIERTDVFVSADGDEASSGTAAGGADVESGHPGVAAEKDPALGGAVLVSVDLARAGDGPEMISLLDGLGALSAEAA